MRHGRIAVIGGSGFVGRHLTSLLADQQRDVIVLTRVREHAQSLIMLPLARIVEVDARNVDALAAATREADAIVNLVGIRAEGSRARFADVHVGITEAAIEACRRNGIRRYVHMSALNADPNGPSAYLRTKGEAEAKVAASGLDWTIFRPSVIFGPEDKFFNMFGTLARLLPIISLPGAKARFQPIYVGDVAAAFSNALDDSTTFGQRYPLCGPRVYTLREVATYAARQVGRRRWIFSPPAAIAKLQAWVLEHVPGKPLTRDDLLSMRVDSVSEGSPAMLFGGPVSAVEDVVPGYLGSRADRYSRYRRRV